MAYQTEYPNRAQDNDNTPEGSLKSLEDDDDLMPESISEEPKIIRRGDTVIKSYVDEKTGRIAVFEKGMKLEVCDFGSGKWWYPAKVSSIKWKDQEVLVHYSNWSSRYDEWISMKSSRLRPSKNTNVVRRQFTLGERVEAVWPLDNVRYTASITQVFPNDMYEVTFDDGYKMKKYAHQIFKVSDEQPSSAAGVSNSSETKNKNVVKPEAETAAVVEKQKEQNGRPMKGSLRRKQLMLKSKALKTPVAKVQKLNKKPSETILKKGRVKVKTEVSQERPLHFSVFDLPKGDLGKRRRTVHDYSILVRGRIPQVKHRKSRSEPEENCESAPLTPAPDESLNPEVFSTPELLPAKPAPLEPSESVQEKETPSLRPRRRPKSGSTTQVPTTPTSPAAGVAVPVEPTPPVLTPELPISDEKVTESPKEAEPESIPPPAEVSTAPKRRKNVPSVSNSSTVGKAATVVETKAPQKSVETKSPQKSVETKAPQKSAEASLLSDVTTAVVTTTVTVTAATTISPVPTASSRRTKSLGAVLAAAPPVAQVDDPKTEKLDSGFVDESGNPIFIHQNNDDGFWKCPLNNCGKNFRKDSLLKMHLKHYHPELKVTRLIANVVQMAQARTAFDNDTIDHHVWSKIPNPEQSLTETTPALEAPEGANVPSNCTETPPLPPKKASKSAHHASSKDTPTSNEKSSPVSKLDEEVATPATAAEANAVATAGNSTAEDASTALNTRSPRLRVNRKRTLFISKRSITKLETPTSSPPPPRSPPKKVKDDSHSARTIATTASSKKPKLVDTVDASVIASKENSHGSLASSSPASSSVTSASNTPSATNTPSDKKSECSVDSFNGSSSSEPVLVPPLCESLSNEKRTSQNRWSKSHIRRGLLNSNIRRVGTSTSLYMKKRMQFRKYMGKRSRQKTASILSRISSGRMRVILESLSQRSIGKMRFRASRRYRDAKVDVINCICNNKTEFGLMIQCELCLCWQHGSCFNVQSNSQLPEYYACQSCSEPEKVRLSRGYEWAESEFFKLGKLPSFPFAPNFTKEDARVMKMCTNMSANLMETYSMVKGLKLKERICFGHPEHPQLYQWNTERAPPHEEIQRDRFKKYFQPVLRRLLLENKSDPAYHSKLIKLAETRLKLRKYSEAVDSARLTLKKKLGSRAAAFLDYICDIVLEDMIKSKRKNSEESTNSPKKEVFDPKKRVNAEQAYLRLKKLRNEILKKRIDESLESSGINRVSSSPLEVPGLGGAFCNGFVNFNTNNLTSPQQSLLKNSNLLFPLKSASTQKDTNGVRRDLSANLRDFGALKKYLKERRTVDMSIGFLLRRMSKEFPEEWKNLLKVSKGFVGEENTEEKSHEEGRTQWVSNVIKTYNSLRILLKQIYSEQQLNSQKQRNFCSDFEKTTIKLFDLFGIGLTEERMEGKKLHKHTSKRIRGLETLDLLAEAQVTSEIPEKSTSSAETPNSQQDEKLITPTSSEPSSQQTVADQEDEHSKSLSQSSDPTTVEDTSQLTQTTTEQEVNEVSQTQSQSNMRLPTDECEWKNVPGSDLLDMARNLKGEVSFEFCDDVSFGQTLLAAIRIPETDCLEEGTDLKFPPKDKIEPVNAFESRLTGIIPVPAVPSITPDVCRKNLVKDIILQQQQIDLYLDKIESQLIKLTSQSRSGGTVNNMKLSELSAQRERMLHSLEMVTRLTKTVIGDNDIDPNGADGSDNSETDSTCEASSTDSTSDSDDDNTSNFSGTDTETADEGDYGYDDDLLDV